MKKSLALTLALIMVLCMLPVTALAASSTGHQISVKIYKVVLDSSQYLGYQNPEFVTTITVTCQDGTEHSGYNHFVNLKEFYPTNFGLTTTDWTGWQFNGYYDKGKDQATFYDWTRDQVNATANVTGSEPYPCSKNFYLVYKEAAPQTQDITLTYNANGGSDAPASETKNVEIGKGATFTVSSQKPTRNNYDFKGWSTDKNAETAIYHGGNSITIKEDTTLYAVWANHEHNDGDGDGYCDTDNKCMHNKDGEGYCTVDGCTHPHEGDGACCPKKPDNKPDKPNPEPSATPAIDGLTGAEVVNVKCVTDGSGHGVETYGLIAGSYNVGEVEGDATNGYTCDITVNPDEYVEAYNTDIGVNHTLAPVVQTGTIKLSWNGTDKKWELANPSGVPVVFTVKCENQMPEKPNPPEPENTSKPFIELTGEEAVKVKCTTAGATHAEKSYGLKHDGYTIGEVKGDAESGYTCDITVNPDKYVEAYNEEIGVNHTLDPESQTHTITLKWKPDVSGDKIGEWVVASVIPVVFTVKCEDVKTYTVTYKDGVGGTAFKDQVYTGLKLGDATPGFTGTPYRWNYTFTGWKPAVEAKVSGNAVYTAQWIYNGGGWTPSYPINPVPPVVVVPPKTGDMPFWYSIAQFLGLVK